MHKIYIFFYSFLVRLLYFIRKFGSPQRSRFRGVETILNGQGVATPPPETLRGWRDGPRHSPEIASACMYLHIYTDTYMYNCINVPI